jgi:cyclophilin family peptidyl-prolyl cis-trans isomerase
MSIGFLRRTGFLLMMGLAFGHTFLAQGQGEGIFAEFNTSMGSFTCRLEYAYAPKAVANFIGLATGQKAWIDQNTGAVKTEPYYDGILFHRVVNGFIIQSGSRNGQGTDGPGYSFVDEFSPSLRYGTAGVLGMANSGTNSNGAQFFITLAPEATLNDHYAIFGELTGGTNVVVDISHVGTFFFTDSPTNPIVLRNVAIRRVGAAAQAFDINAQGLPVVTSQHLDIANAGTNQLALSFSNRVYTENFLFSTPKFYLPGIYTNVYVTTNYFSTNVVMGVTNSTQTNATVTNIVLNTSYATNIYATNFASWGEESLGIEVPNSPMTNTFYRTRSSGSDSGYYRLAQVIYPPIYVPRTVQSRTLTLNFDDGLGTIVINFNATNGGTYVPPPSDPPGTIENYSWSQTYYQGSLDVAYSGFILPMSLNFFFSSASNGAFGGTVNSDAPYPVTGNFTLSP